MEKFEEERVTRESRAWARLDFGARREFEISTGKAFLNHMVETLAWRAGANIDAKFECKTYALSHVVCEDCGIALGRAFRRVFESKMDAGIEMNGFAFCVLDEAKSFAAISVEGRSNSFILRQCEAAKTEVVEDLQSADLAAFLEGFAQGLRGTVRVELQEGVDPHHAWETAFRALGEALRNSLRENAWRKGACAGVKQTLD